MNGRTCALLLLPILAFLSASGCTADRLRYISTRHAGTLGDLYEQQVLDNLAKFVVNPHATPSFATASQGTSGAERTEEYGLSEGAFTGHFWSFISIKGAGSSDNNFTLDMVTSPERLRLMQCAYQRAVGVPPEECQKCCELLEAWTGNPNACSDPCGITCGWVCHSESWWDVPKCCCNKYAKHCGIYVWADPDYRHEFSKLVMTILDFANGEKYVPPPKLTEEVTYYLDKDGNPATPDKATRVVTATRPFEVGLDDTFKRSLSQTIERKKEILRALNDAEGDEAIRRQARMIKQAHPDLARIVAGIDELEADPTVLRNAVLGRLSAEIDDDQSRLQEMGRQPLVEGAGRRQIDFGPPTQFNGLYGDSLMKFQQRLNTIPFQRPPRTIRP